MKDSLETLRDVLLVFSVVLLVYILYKRLLKVLGKKEKSKQYPSLGEELVWKDTRTASFSVTLEEKNKLELMVFDSLGNKKLDIIEGPYEIGTHTFDVNLQSLPAGKYYLKVISEHQEASRYFDLV